MNMVEISNLSFSYSGHAPFLFQSVTETLTDGSWTSITGESGSGKSTLIRLMLGLLKPSAGSIRVPRGTRIGFVPQASDYAYSDFPITLLEALTIYERLRTRTEKGILASLRIGKTNLRDSALLALESVDLGHRAEALVSTISGGEMKRFYLSRALISSPALLILDEPSSGLDPKRAEEIYELIRHVHEKHHLTVIAVEHNLGAARRYSDRILELKDGRLTESEALHA